MNEVTKIGLACFIGGAVCSWVALLVNPQFWYLGLLAGIPAGYLTYDLKELWQRIPIVWRMARQTPCALWKAMRAIIQTTIIILKDLGKRLISPHPIFHLAIIIWLPIYALQADNYIKWITGDAGTTFHSLLLVDKAMFIFFGWLIWFPLSSYLLLRVIASIGSRWVDNAYWLPLFSTEIWYVKLELIQELKKSGLQEKPLTYGNTLRWVILGVWFFVWPLWRNSVVGILAFVKSVAVLITDDGKSIRQAWFCLIGAYTGLILAYVCILSFELKPNNASEIFMIRLLAVGIFTFGGIMISIFIEDVLLPAIINLIKLIHSKKRVICAIDGTIGGGFSYLVLAANASSLTEQFAIVIFGGLIGAGLGVLNYEIISRRIFHLDQKQV